MGMSRCSASARIRLVSALVLVGCLQAAALASAADVDSIREGIRLRLERLIFGYGNTIAGEVIPTAAVLAQVYASAHRPLWRDRERIEQLWKVAALAEAQGLDPADYPLEAVRALLPARGLPTEAGLRADLDLLATDALVRMVYQLRFGKVGPDQRTATWQFNRSLLNGEQSAATISRLMSADSLASAVSALFDRGPLYQRWVTLLAEQRQLQAAGGWPTVSAGPTLRVGDRGARVLEVRRRIAGSDRLATDGEVFDAALERAVRRFQDRHELETDGIVGPRTLAAMNVSAARRVGQIRATLERARWVFDDLAGQPEMMVLVNIASARARLLRGWETIWSGRAVVGQPERQTPTFRAVIDYLVINPSWTVPPTILERDILPAVRRDGPVYLEQRHMDVLDAQGRPVDASRVDWSVLRAEDFAYSIRQRPGPWNMLGRIKFVFPNRYFVFMHDTPTKELFSRSCRALSSGCIRVEDPFELAELMLADRERWNGDAFRELLDQNKTEAVHLPQPLPIVLIYATAESLADGVPRFYEDVYGLDAPLLAVLDTAPTLTEP